MGLWLRAGVPPRVGPGRHDYDELHRLAAEAPDDVALFDPDDDAFLAPGRHAGADRRAAASGPASAPPGDARRDGALRS